MPKSMTLMITCIIAVKIRLPPGAPMAMTNLPFLYKKSGEPPPPRFPGKIESQAPGIGLKWPTKLLYKNPNPFVTTPEPANDPNVCVQLTAVPSSSMTDTCVVSEPIPVGTSGPSNGSFLILSCQYSARSTDVYFCSKLRATDSGGSPLSFK